MNSDFKDLLRLFNERKVRYLIVGGHAVMKYTEPRYTKDLDLWIDASPKNARAVFKALRDFGAPLTNITEADFAREGTFYQMGRPPTRVDILMSVAGLRFTEAWRRREISDFDGVAAPILSHGDLLTNKKAAGRPQDLIDAALLEESGRLREKPADPPPTTEPPRPKKSRKRRGSL